MKIITGTVKEELDLKAIDIFKDACISTLARKDKFVIAIPGGRAVQGMFRLFNSSKEIPWDDIHIFMVDERLPDTFGEQSNFRLASDIFIDRLKKDKKISEANIHPFYYMDGKVDIGLRDYCSRLRDAGNKFDLVVLSAGEDSHVASLFPDHPSIKDDSGCYIYTDDSPKPPPERISASRKLIMRSGYCILLFYGQQKRKAYEMFNDRDKDMISCPSKIAYKIKNSYVLTDIN